MILLALLLGGVGLALICRLAFLLAVHAAPLFTGAAVAVALHAHGAGWPTAMGLGALAGVVTLAAFHLGMEIVRPPALRASLAALFALPAATAGYHLAHGLATPLVASAVERQLLSWLVGGLVAASAWTRLARTKPHACPSSSIWTAPTQTGQPHLAPDRR